MSKATCLIIAMVLMTALFVIFKCYAIITIPWLWVFCPFWIVGAEGFIMAVLDAIVNGKKKKEE